MIEIGSFIGLAAMTQSEITIKDCQNSTDWESFQRPFRKNGIKSWNFVVMIFMSSTVQLWDWNFYKMDRSWNGLLIRFAWIYSGSANRLFWSLAYKAKGTCLDTSKMFFWIQIILPWDKLIDMGAQIILCDPNTCLACDWFRSKISRSW